MWVFGEIGCLLVSAWTLISGWSQIRVHLWLIQTSSGEVSSEILWMCYQSCSGCWQIWGVLFVWEFITTDPSSRCSWFILQKLQKTLGFPWCIQFMNVHWRFCQTIKWHKCAFSSLPMNASWVKSIVHVLFMPMHLSSVICVWRPNSGLSEIPLKLKQGVGTLSMKCFTLNVVSRLSSALLCPIWWLKLRAQSHQTLSKMLWLH